MITYFKGQKPASPTTSNIDYIRQASSTPSQSMLILSKLEGFNAAMNSTIGKELLQDLVNMHSVCLQKIVSLEAIDRDKIEYEMLTSLIQRWVYKINSYEQALREINQSSPDHASGQGE